MYYVYRYLDADNRIIYIGITNNLLKRRNEHRNATWYNDNFRYEFIKLHHKHIAEIYETYLINKYNPENNKAKKNIDTSLIEFNFSPLWQNFDEYELKKEKKRKSTVKRKKNKLSHAEIQKNNEKILDTIIHNYKEQIIDRYYDKYESLIIKFNSIEVKNLCSQMNGFPKVVSSFCYNINNENINTITFKNEFSRGNDVDINKKYNEIVTLLEIDKFKLDKKMGVRKEEERKELKRLNCINKIQNNHKFTFINMRTKKEKKLSINDFINMKGGLIYCIHTGNYIEYKYKNNSVIEVSTFTYEEIKENILCNYDEYCVKEIDFFEVISYKLYKENIAILDALGDEMKTPFLY